MLQSPSDFLSLIVFVRGAQYTDLRRPGERDFWEIVPPLTPKTTSARSGRVAVTLARAGIIHRGISSQNGR